MPVSKNPTVTIINNTGLTLPVTLFKTSRGNPYQGQFTGYNWDVSCEGYLTRRQVLIEARPVGSSDPFTFLEAIAVTATLQGIIDALNSLGIGYFSFTGGSTLGSQTNIIAETSTYELGQLAMVPYPSSVNPNINISNNTVSGGGGINTFVACASVSSLPSPGPSNQTVGSESGDLVLIQATAPTLAGATLVLSYKEVFAGPDIIFFTQVLAAGQSLSKYFAIDAQFEYDVTFG